MKVKLCYRIMNGGDFSLNLVDFVKPGAVFTKGLREVSGLSWLYFCTKVKPKTWLRPFVNTAPEGFPGILVAVKPERLLVFRETKHLSRNIGNYYYQKSSLDFISVTHETMELPPY